MNSPPASTARLSLHAPIVVFDSGIGGLSILRKLQEQLPHEYFIYYADSAYTPYGERSEVWIQNRVLSLVDELVLAYQPKLLVIACNTATMAAISLLRLRHPIMPIVGTEPAVKPAVAATRTGVVAVWATRRTIESVRLAQLFATYPQTHFLPIACDGLAEAIEGYAAGQGVGNIAPLLRTYAAPLMSPSLGEGARADVLVLGCTHYPLIASEISACLPPEVQLLETGSAVARQAVRVLFDHSLMNEKNHSEGCIEWMASGPTDSLLNASRLLTPTLLCAGSS